MTRAIAVAVLVGCACGQSSNLPASPSPACPTCPAVPCVDLALCPVERPGPPIVVTEPPEDSILLRGNGFWCTAFVAGEWAGESDCFRLRETCEVWRRRYRRYKMDECRPAERASCMRVIDYKLLGLYFRCVPPDQCEAIRAAMVSRRPDRDFSECRELN